MPHVYVDADDCPVKSEVLRVAARYGLAVTFVANTGMFIANEAGQDACEGERVRLQVVPRDLDAADDWIALNVAPHDIVVCSDIPLAARCIERGAAAVNSRGREFTEDDIGNTLATRDLLKSLREAMSMSGPIGGGPKPFGARDRSAFLQTLDRLVHASRRNRARAVRRGEGR